MYYLPIISETLSEAKPPLIPEGMRGRFEAGDDYEGFNELTGDIVFEAHPILAGIALKAWAGQSSGTLSGSVYTHEFIPRTVDFDKFAAVPPMTIEVYRDAGSGMQFYDMLCDQLTIEIAHGALQKITMGMIGGKAQKTTKTSPSYLPGSEYTWDQASISYGGSANDQFSQITVVAKNNLEAKGTLNGTKTPSRIKRSDYRVVEVSGTVLVEDDTMKDDYRSKTTKRVVLCSAGQNVSSGYPANLIIDIPSFRFAEYPDNIEGPTLMEAGFSAEAKYNTGSATMIKFSLTNTLSTY
jgi:hypothetical protein